MLQALKSQLGQQPSFTDMQHWYRPCTRGGRMRELVVVPWSCSRFSHKWYYKFIACSSRKQVAEGSYHLQLIRADLNFLCCQKGEQFACIMHIYTVKPVLSGHSKIDKTKVLETNVSLMKVESIAECSLGAFCNTWPALSNNQSWEPIFVFILSGHLRQVLL